MCSVQKGTLLALAQALNFKLLTIFIPMGCLPSCMKYVSAIKAKSICRRCFEGNAPATWVMSTSNIQR